MPVVIEGGEQGGVRGVEGPADIGEAVGDGRVADEDAVDRRGLDAAGGRGRVEGEPGNPVGLLRKIARKCSWVRFLQTPIETHHRDTKFVTLLN